MVAFFNFNDSAGPAPEAFGLSGAILSGKMPESRSHLSLPREATARWLHGFPRGRIPARNGPLKEANRGISA